VERAEMPNGPPSISMLAVLGGMRKAASLVGR
jgi:hypothetical protein